MANNKSNSQDNNNDRIVISGGGVDNEAVNLIRDKISRLYREEPDVRTEIAETTGTKPQSRHQRYMLELKNSGKDIATIQTEWHNYYIKLSDRDKNQVWQEFYAGQAAFTGQVATPVANAPAVNPLQLAQHKQEAARPKKRAPTKTRPSLKDARSTKQIREDIKDKVTSGGRVTAKHHLQSLAFGLGMGLVVIFIFLFSFFNEVFITPFIQPSSVSADTPIILSGGGVAPSTTPQVIIPKIDVQIPVDYSETSTSEAAIENDLEDGVVHYPTTVEPGQIGNAAFFGHSSNNIFNPGKYKFAFVLLHTLVDGDTFYLTYNDKVYVYKVISKTVVSPSDVNVLNTVPGQTATATLITCDPPGTSINRLIVVGQQISPSPSGNTTPTITAVSSSTTTTLPGNGPTLWSRFINSSAGKLISTVVIIGAAGYLVRRLDKRFRH